MQKNRRDRSKRMNEAQLAQHIAENPRIDLAGNVMSVGEQVIFAGPEKTWGRSSAARLLVGRIVRFTEHGVTMETKIKRDAWSLDTMNTPYRATKFLRVDSVPDLVLQ
jgi:hypothetical protein